MDPLIQIAKRRRQIIVHRYIYYVLSTSLITDLQYDMWDRELTSLVAQYPEAAATAAYADDCPSKCVGSSNLWDYPRELQYLGDSLVAFNERWPFGYIPEEDDTAQPAFTGSMFGD